MKKFTLLLLIIWLVALSQENLFASQATADLSQVRFEHGKIEIPTYTFSRAETVAPLFSSAENPGIYPYTPLDRNSMSERPRPVQYESLTIENEYIRVMFLPELGGRIWSARDKLADREIFYYTSVIKPSGYNQRGAWPAGNLELYGPYDAHMLTWPGEPWSWALVRHDDGSATIVLSHVDHFFRDKVSLQVTLHPARAFLETTVRLHNRNMLPNRYLLWTNAGIAAGEGTRFIYPMTKTIGHNSSELGTWPVMNGVDLSWYKNNQNMLGVFGLDIYDNFIAAYDFQKDRGTICYTDRLLARGIKTWTWGVGTAAQRHLASYTDHDGPYVEVQSGRFVWDGNYEFIGPGKTDGWTEYWYGVSDLGGLTTANRDVAVKMDIAPEKSPSQINLAIAPTGNFGGATFELASGDAVIWHQSYDLKVGNVFRSSIPLKSIDRQHGLTLRITDQGGRSLLKYPLSLDGSHPNAVFAGDSIPRHFGAPETLSAEEAFQQGISYEKFGQLEEARQAYQLALTKDHLFAPAHLQLGLLALDRLQYAQAIEHFQHVLERDPVNSDAHYYLAVLYTEMGRTAEARLHYARLLPSSPNFDRRDYGLALLALQSDDMDEAGRLLDKAFVKNADESAVRQAHLYLNRKKNRTAEMSRENAELLKLDPTNAFAQAETFFANEASAEAQEKLDRACVNHAQGYLELATEYMRLSAWTEAGRLLDRGIQKALAAQAIPEPMLYYYRAYIADRSANAAIAQKAIAAAEGGDLRLEIFPFRRESIQVLNRVLEMRPAAANAASLLGDILYNRARRGDALASWRAALKANPKNFSALRDLGLALLEEGKTTEAVDLLTKAAEVRPDDLGVNLQLMDIDARSGNIAAARGILQRALSQKPGDDFITEKLASVEAQSGNYDRALELLTTHTFAPRHLSYSLLHLYQNVRLMMTLNLIKSARNSDAMEQLRLAQHPPTNLGTDDFTTIQSSRLLFFQALAYEAQGDAASARKAWTSAAQTVDDDSEHEGLFRAIAQYKIGETKKAEEWFDKFQSSNERRKTSASAEIRLYSYYLAGVYAAFRGDDKLAQANFQKASEIDQSNLFAKQALTWLSADMLKTLKSSPSSVTKTSPATQPISSSVGPK